jgi:hypothetical protein
MHHDEYLGEEQQEGGDPPEESKRERFLRVAERRTNNALYRIRVLSNCANTYSYEFYPEDIAKIFGAIEQELAKARARFEPSVPSKFTLREDEDGDEAPPSGARREV